MSIQIDLKGKTALLTGGGRGLGKAIAEVLAKAGANVFIGNRKEAEGESVVEELRKLGVKADFKKVDVSVDAEVEEFFRAGEAFAGGKIDFVVNNAGVIETVPFLELDGEGAKRVYDINVIGLSNVVRCALKKMIAQKEGRIVTTSSIAGIAQLGMLEHYSATKAAVVSLTKNLAKVAAPYHINVNSVAPGIIRTKMWEEILDSMTGGSDNADCRNSTFDDSVKKLIPFGVPQVEEDIADAVLFLCSHLSKEITGQVIAVDGGTTA
ncbi:SDR family NAD(P)-dependent oxidoreductase [Pyramidobacter piscolens]|uniref:Oxidoreductase, short chain dehydrogenase/reductase family protein n=1 Tax=Pyramidobacter piscolens W5455 TaxID=352165 RepID=A0ABM9ZTT2_9BACT|nr:SDR family NAD(P)-dependent oxidoreductase [Pyramidobacter piscolens]EFB90310.1 oxidoreductase, short chain dehydrogenase/reductase family protein [Pyramidobacter piscolens W5455]BDF77542.1 beta-ketoacyl-ACP reductase [Pyramidobacter piscolens]